MKVTWTQRTIAMNLRSFRQQALDTAPLTQRGRYTQAALAKELSIDERAYREMEKGESEINFDRLLHLARYLDVSPIDLVAPKLGDGEVMIQVKPRGGHAVTVEAVPVERFLLWWQGVKPLPSQHLWRWRARRGMQRSDVGFADARFASAIDRVEGRNSPDGTVEGGAPLSSELIEAPERPQIYAMLDRYWTACAAGDDEAADWASEAIHEALQTGRRRAQGDPHPDAPVWNGEKLPLIGDEQADGGIRG